MDFGFSLLHKTRRAGIFPISLHEAVAVEIMIGMIRSSLIKFNNIMNLS